MKSLKQTLSVAALVVLSAISIRGIAQAIVGTPASQDNRDPTAVLSALDLQQLDVQQRRRAARWLGELLDSGYDLRRAVESLPADERSRVASTAQDLAAQRIEEAVDVYFARNAADRDAWLDRQLERWQRWRLPPLKSPAPAEPTPAMIRRLALERQAMASAAQQERITKFLGEIENRVLSSHLRRWLPAGS